MMHVDRRQFAALLTAVGLSSPRSVFPQSKIQQPEILNLSRNGWVPNNDHLPVLIYHRQLISSGPDPASAFEEAFRRTAGLPNGEMASTTFIITTPPHTKFWDSPPASPPHVGWTKWTRTHRRGR